MKNSFLLILTVAIALFGINFSVALAFQIEDLKIAPGNNDFVLGPGKTELFLDPGAKATKEFTVTNRLGKTMTFQISIEDMKGSQNLDETVVLLGAEKGPYSLKDYIKPETTEFTLNHGQRMILPVEITIPEDAEPGGLYGSLLVNAVPPKAEGATEEGQAQGQIQLVTRLGALFFVRVNGEAKEEGALKDFTMQKNFYEKGPVSFQILYENTGDVHVNPYGIVEIKNIFGRKVDEIRILPYFAMPSSLRLREAVWERGLLFGKYTASLSLNRGYKNIIDQKSITFWVFPWKIILAGALALILVISFFVWVASRFEFRRKEPKNKNRDSISNEG